MSYFSLLGELPPHIAHPDRQVVGPLINFRGHAIPVDHAPPRDTTDPRYLKCADHHLACDCREAEQNEVIGEYRAGYREIEDQLATMIDGHPTFVDVDGEDRPDLQCQCVACKIVRITRRGFSYHTNARSVKLNSHMGRW